ncbi:prephenate dehydrogenase [Corynebacterium aquatimens]|nr:prephenate dehydrogenase [Corynebacterium aquatimens]
MDPSKNSLSVCVLGLGLIGGSIMRDLAAADVEVFGYNRSAAGARGAEKDGFDVTTDLTAVLQRAEKAGALIVIAVPMHAVGVALDAINEHAPNCGITDVVSVKAAVYDLVRERGMGQRYVGGHPMAGTEYSGWMASKTGLFDGAAWAVAYDYALENPTSQKWMDVFGQVCAVAQICGSEIVPVTVGHHDESVARVSHLPHVLAEALAVIGDRGGTLAQSLAAGSFAGATRVAGTKPELVRAMCETNGPALVKTLDEIIPILQKAREDLETPTIKDLAEAGNNAYVRFGARASRPVMRINPGGPGWVDQLKQAESIGGRIEVM